jgi:hypothetical protein
MGSSLSKEGKPIIGALHIDCVCCKSSVSKERDKERDKEKSCKNVTKNKRYDTNK